MSKSEGKPESRPVIVPDCFSGEESYEDWMDQFESIAEINCWDEEQKLKWVVYNHWTGLVDWTGGLDYWTQVFSLF